MCVRNQTIEMKNQNHDQEPIQIVSSSSSLLEHANIKIEKVTSSTAVDVVSFSDSQSQYVKKSHGGTDLEKLKCLFQKGNGKISSRNSSH